MSTEVQAKKVVKKVAKPSEHPPVASMVKSAITSLKDRKGSSLIAIKKHILENNKGIDMIRLAPFIRRYLKKAVTEGSVVQNKASFKMGAKPKEEKPKKVAKKPATKPKKAKTPTKKSDAKKTTAKKSDTKKTTKKTPKKTTKKPVSEKKAKKSATKASPKKVAKKPVAKKLTKKPAAKKTVAK